VPSDPGKLARFLLVSYDRRHIGLSELSSACNLEGVYAKYTHPYPITPPMPFFYHHGGYDTIWDVPSQRDETFPRTPGDYMQEVMEPPVLAEVVIESLDMALIDWLNDPDDPFEKRLSPFTELIGDVIRSRE
jgi:hypothetical protein